MPLQLATFECTCGLGQKPDKPPIFENPPGCPDKGQKENVSGESWTFGNPIYGIGTRVVGPVGLGLMLTLTLAPTLLEYRKSLGSHNMY